ncbi:MAG TPA: EI24 domain-containing protein [Acetobacteraceae bacterium]
MLTPTIRAVSQLGDRSFLGVLLRCLAWSVVCFVALHVAAVWAVQRVLAVHGPLGFAADVLASIGATLVALWLFVPLAAAIGTLYFDRIAAAVERRYYPLLPPAPGAPIMAQLADGLIVFVRILLLSMLALVLMLIVPGIGFVLAWAVGAYALGRGMFVAVAMRRMPRRAAESLYRQCRWQVLAQGGIMAAAAYLPLVNLLLPILATAAMVHVLDSALSNTAGLRRY